MGNTPRYEQGSDEDFSDFFSSMFGGGQEEAAAACSSGDRISMQD